MVEIRPRRHHCPQSREWLLSLNYPAFTACDSLKPQWYLHQVSKAACCGRGGRRHKELAMTALKNSKTGENLKVAFSAERQIGQV